MKKFVMVLLVLAVVGVSAFAFDPLSYPPPLSGGGKLMVDVGAGLAFGYGSGKMSIPPLFGKVEYALPVEVPISVGGIFGFYQYKWDYSGFGVGWKETWTFMYFGGLANWHWGFDVSWLDLYTGITIGYLYYKWESDYKGDRGWYSEPSYGGFTFGGQIGAHFYFTNTVGLMLEIGYPFLKVGLALKF